MTIQLVQNLPLTSKPKFRFGLARSGQSGIFCLEVNRGFAQAEWSPCTKTQLSHQCQQEVWNKVLGHPVHDSDARFPIVSKVPIMFNETTFKCARGWSGRGAAEPDEACNNCLYSGGYFHHYDFYDGERDQSYVTSAKILDFVPIPIVRFLTVGRSH